MAFIPSVNPRRVTRENVPICTGCWRKRHPHNWTDAPWRYTEDTATCHFCGNETDSSLTYSVLVTG